MQQKQIETPVKGVRDGIFAVEDRPARLRHDGAIEGRNGVGPPVAAKQGQNHQVGSGQTAVMKPGTSTVMPMQGGNGLVIV
jgi:hypothetical protein